MTEIPEHLLKRSKERRAAMGLGGGETPGDATPEAGATGDAAADPSSVEKPAVAPAAARSAAPVPAAAPPPPPPDPPYVAAAKSRKKVPMWAAPVLAALPLWGFIYFQSLQKPPAGADDPLALGQEVYDVKGGCVGCHGSDGSGGIGAKLKDGEVIKTFKNPLSMVHWIAFGAAGGARANGTYGDLTRPGGPHNLAALPSQMPAQKDSLSSEELAAVTMYVRQKISGGKPDKGFDVADFPTLGDVVTKVIALGPGGDPKVPGGSGSKAATTKVAGKSTSSSSSGSAGGSSGAGSTGGTSKTRGTGTNSSGGSGPSNNADTSGSSGTGSGGTSGSGGSKSSGGSGGSGSSNSSGGSGGSGTGGSAGGGG